MKKRWRSRVRMAEVRHSSRKRRRTTLKANVDDDEPDTVSFSCPFLLLKDDGGDFVGGPRCVPTKPTKQVGKARHLFL